MRVEELAKKLVKIESESPVTSREKYGPVEDFLNENNIEFEFIEHNGVKSLLASAGSGRPHICLAGHFDVVPSNPEEWSVCDPYDPVERKGRLYGRGSSDMKGGLAAQMLAMTDLIERDQFDGRISLLVTGDEELGGPDGAGKILEDHSDFEYALIAEPTDMKLQTGFRGKIQFDIFLEGEGTHASRPHLVDNILLEIPGVVNSIEGIGWESSSTELPDSTLAITQVESYGPRNSIPSRARIGIDFRNSTDHDFEKVKSKIERNLPEDLSFTVELDHSKPPVLVEDQEFIEAVDRAYESVENRTPEHTSEGGSSDGAHFSRQGIESLEIGTEQDTIHAPDEYASVADLRQLRRILRGSAENLCS